MQYGCLMLFNIFSNSSLVFCILVYAFLDRLNKQRSFIISYLNALQLWVRFYQRLCLYIQIFSIQSMSDFLLKTDATEITKITSMRVMVSAALLFTFTVHYLFIAFVHIFNKKVKVQRIYDHGRRLVLYGMAALFSISFLNYGIYHAILAWLLFICMLIMHSMAVIVQIRENFQNIAITIYYILIGIWFFGILFFYMFNALE